jgi:hypothetical protein
VSGCGVRPQDHSQAPAEVACQCADAGGGAPKFVRVTGGLVHPPSIADKALLTRSSAILMISRTYDLSDGSVNRTRRQDDMIKVSQPGTDSTAWPHPYGAHGRQTRVTGLARNGPTWRPAVL